MGNYQTVQFLTLPLGVSLGLSLTRPCLRRALAGGALAEWVPNQQALGSFMETQLLPHLLRLSCLERVTSHPSFPQTELSCSQDVELSTLKLGQAQANG